jgi:hypothetical protein
MLKVEKISITEKSIKKTPALNELVALMKKHHFANGYESLPTAPYHEVSFDLVNTYPGFANGVRRTLVEEIDVVCADADESKIRTDDEFISGMCDVILKNINLLPVRQDLDIDGMSKYSIYLIKTNKTNDIIDVTASDFIIGDADEVRRKSAVKLQKDLGDPSLQKPETKKKGPKKPKKTGGAGKKISKNKKMTSEYMDKDSDKDSDKDLDDSEDSDESDGDDVEDDPEENLEEDGNAVDDKARGNKADKAGKVGTKVVGATGTEDDVDTGVVDDIDAEIVDVADVADMDKSPHVSTLPKKSTTMYSTSARLRTALVNGDDLSHGAFKLTEAILARAYAEDERSVKPITHVFPNSNITIARLRPGKTLYIESVGFKAGRGIDTMAKFSLLNNVTYQPINVDPYDSFNKTGTRSIEYDPKEFRLGFTTAGNINPKRVISLVADSIITALQDMKKYIETYSTAETKKYYSSDDLVVTVKDDVYTYKFLRHYFTPINMVAQRCFLIDTNVLFCTGGVERYDTPIGIIKLKHAEPNKLLIKSIEGCIEDAKILEKAFAK